jgi:hypothetical protein
MNGTTKFSRGALIAALGAITVAAVVGGGGAAASAAETDAWSTFTVTGADGAYSGTLSLLNDQPTWTDNEDTGLLLGNAGAADTEGAAAWFSPSTALRSLTMSFPWRSGFPVYQTWFAEKSFRVSGLATLDGQPAADVAVTVYDTNDVPVATTTTGPDGS